MQKALGETSHQQLFGHWAWVLAEQTHQIHRQRFISCGIYQQRVHASSVVIIDVGINDKPDKTKKRGYKLVGDVNYHDCIASGNVKAITPVPGGVGPMTIIMLMKNTINLCRHSLNLTRLKLRTKEY